MPKKFEFSGKKKNGKVATVETAPVKRGRVVGLTSGTGKVTSVVVDIPKRGPGRPRTKLAEHVAVVRNTKDVRVSRDTSMKGRGKHVDNGAVLVASNNGTKGLTATKAVEHLQGVLGRVEVMAFRGKKVRPQLVLSAFEEQALREALALFQLKISMQQSGQLKKVKTA